ncbi:hypothetical protein [Streptacidiphilus neutrinimicus]|uniref:hypothetical protein n=1 Tax=Streptacidiphilus neutrinimicus TaxID=105420 RepID=UPI0005A9C079|nr:hypothetical protein [Streptacidiphilus neutrinimicus]
MTAVGFLVAVLCIGGLAVAMPRVRAWNRRRAAEHEAWLRGIQDSDREVALLDEIRRRRSPAQERRE